MTPSRRVPGIVLGFFFIILYRLYLFVVCTVSSWVLGLFSSFGKWGLPIIGRMGFSLLWLLSGLSTALGRMGFRAAAPQSCSPSAVASPRLQAAGSVGSLWHVKSSRPGMELTAPALAT